MIKIFIYFLSDLFEKRIFVSSAQCSINECEIALFRSLMYIRKSKGPRADRSGTPQDITVSLERVFFY